MINNQAKGIQYETMNTLCTYLGIAPGELFTFAPVDVRVVGASIHSDEIRITVMERGKETPCTMPARIVVMNEPIPVDDDGNEAHVPNAIFANIDASASEVFARCYRSLPVPLKQHVEDIIAEALAESAMESCPLDPACMSELHVELDIVV
jgi:hypothetical protein